MAEPDMLSHYDYWQYWRNVDDAMVVRLRRFTTLPIDEIERLETLEGQEINDAMKILADEATKMCRGEDAANNRPHKRPLCRAWWRSADHYLQQG